MEIYELTVHELAEKLEKKEITSEELVKSYFDRIKEKDKDVKAYVLTLEEKAIEKAKEIDKARSNGEKVGKYAGLRPQVRKAVVTLEKGQSISAFEI